MPRKHTNKITAPRLLAALPDPRVVGIQEAVRRCSAFPSFVRENVMYGRTLWPAHLVAAVDDLVMKGATTEQIMALGDALRDACYVSVLVGTQLPEESVADALAREAVIEGEANRDAMKLLENPRDPSRLRALARSLGTERDITDVTRRRVVAEIHVLEAERQRA